MDPSDHDKRDLGNGPSGDHGPTHGNGGPPGDEGWLRSVLENSSEVVKVLDPDGTLRYASPAFGRVFGHDPGEVVGEMNVLDHVHPEDLPRVVEETEKATSVGGTVSNRVEYRFRHKDGSWRWVESVGTYLLDDPAVRGVVVSVRDVTRRKEAEAALRETEERYRTLVERVPAIIYIQRPIEGKTASYDTTYMSPRVEEVLGYPARAFVEDPHRWYGVIHPGDRDRVRAEDERTDQTGEPFSMEYRVVRKDGGVVWLGDEATLVRDGSGEPLYWLGVQRDITARKDWEETLKESEERYRIQSRELSLLHQVRSNLSRELDPESVCYEVVEAIAETYGYTQVSAYLLEGEDLVLQHQVGYERVIERIPVSEGITGRTVRTGRSVLVEDVRGDPDFLGAIEGITSEICVPLFDGGEAAGFINVESRGGVRLTGEDLRVMEALGEHVNGALSRAKLHARLRDSEEHFRALTQNSSDLVTLLSANGTIRYQSPAIERILGYGQGETIGDNAFGHVHPDDLSRVEMAFAEGLVDPGRRPSVEYRFRHKDGRWVWLESVGNNLLDEPGVGGYVVNSREVTGRKEAERALTESEERFRRSFQDAAIGMALMGLDGRWLRVNKSLCEIVGYPEEELLEKTFQQITHPDDLEVDLDLVRRMLTGDIRTYQMEKRYLHRDGHVVWILLNASMVHGEGGEPLYFVSQIQDISKRKRAEERLSEAEERYRTLVERIPAVTHVEEVGETQGTMYMSPQVEDLLGYPQEDWLSGIDHWKRCLHPEDRERVLAENAHANETGETFRSEYRMVHRDGRVVWVHEEAVLAEGPGGRSRSWLGVMTDITDRRVLEERLERQALHDPLTDLPNRRLFADRLRHALEGTRRRGGGVAVLFTDLDDFKVVNDSLGHEAGDLLLTVVAQRLGRCVRPEDTLARFGGDEFVVLIEDVGDISEAVKLAERITEELRRPFVLEGRELHVSASVGISSGNVRTKTPEELLRDADTAMYRAKDGGGGFRVFDPAMHERVARRLDLENDLRRAVERGEFVLHYQPVFDFGDQRMWGTEALLRWDHPERGLLGPNEFVAAAEETGLIVPIGAWALGEACRRTKGWQDAYPQNPPPGLIVNLSARQLRHPRCEGAIRAALESSGLPPESLSLDVTETTFIDALEGNRVALERIQALGVRISIDDFGMGYSSLSYLKRLPADALKIDRSFLRGFGEDARDTALVRMVIDVGHTLGMRVIAEGVEEWAQATLLAEMGCDMAQGYHFSRPLSPEEVPGFLGV